MNSVATAVPSDALGGRLLGGQNPIVGATVSVYAYGKGGYGSAGTKLASTTTDSTGSFSFASNAYTCPQNSTPVYLISVGGDSGSGTNPNAVLGAALGQCSGAHFSFVVVNEVTTTALAYALSHFFTTTLGTGTGTADQYDSFGGPSSTSGTSTTYSVGLVQGNNYTDGLLAVNNKGLAQVSNNVMTAEPLKVYSIANILATCVNSAGLTSPTDTTSACGQLFSLTTPPGSAVRPSDTLQAAVQIALYPTQNVAALYALPNTRTAFPASLSSQPNDWSLAVSYTSANLGLGVDTLTLSTLDIDANGKVWFPSNASGKVGLASFDPTSSAFGGPYNSTSLVHPEQVAIDGNGYVWLSDTGSSAVPGYNAASPTNTAPLLALANSVSDSVVVAADSTIKVGAVIGSSVALGSINTSRNAYTNTGVTIPNSPTVAPSLASDASNNLGAVFSSSGGQQSYSYLASGGTGFTAKATGTDNPGQISYNGHDLFGVLQFDGTSGHAADSLCFVNGGTTAGCYAFAGTTVADGASGLAIDGTGTAWVTDNANATVRYIPYFNTTTHSYLNGTTIPTNILNHNSSNGGTFTAPEGVAIDAEGNVWVSNAGCLTTGCTPGSFVLSQIIGTAAPTITPISAQITAGNLAGTQPTY